MESAEKPVEVSEYSRNSPAKGSFAEIELESDEESLRDGVSLTHKMLISDGDDGNDSDIRTQLQGSSLLASTHLEQPRKPSQDSTSSGGEKIGTDAVEVSKSDTIIKLFPARWYVLVVFSLQTFMSNALCYQYAPISSNASSYYDGADISWTITLFFVSYIPLTFPVSRALDRYGLKRCMFVASLLQATGAGIRCIPSAGGGGSQVSLFLGQTIISLGQCCYVNSPPQLSSMWFGDRERTFATTIAVNANTLGIAGAYLLGPLIASSPDDVLTLNSVSFAIVFGLFFLVIPMPGRPSHPPSKSSLLKAKDELALSISWKTVKNLFSKPGFGQALALFSIAEATINIYATFLDQMLSPLGVSSSNTSTLGVVFICCCILGSGAIGWIVDRTRTYFSSLVASLLLTLVFQIVFSSVFLCCDTPAMCTMVGVIIGLGLSVGPIQPVSLELAAECTYPSSEASFTAIMQLLGNIYSALLVPMMESLKNRETQSFNKGEWLLFAFQGATLLYFFFFRGRYVRLSIDQSSHPRGREADQNGASPSSLKCLLRTIKGILSPGENTKDQTSSSLTPVEVSLAEGAGAPFIDSEASSSAAANPEDKGGRAIAN